VPPRKKSGSGPKRRSIPEALAIARGLTRDRKYEVDLGVIDELAALGHVGQEGIEAALAAAFEEVTPECHQPIAEEFDNPGLPFIWNSSFFRGRMYLKFTLIGTKHKPRLFIWSCHTPTW
jgi:hypothetical protein